MTSRDRIVAIVVGAVVLLAAFWFLALRRSARTRRPQREDHRGAAAPRRAPAGDGGRHAARERYDADYATVAKLGKAVPADDDVASLVYQLDHVSTGSHIDFRSIKLDQLGHAAPLRRRRPRRPPSRRRARRLLDASDRDDAERVSAPRPPPRARRRRRPARATPPRACPRRSRPPPACRPARRVGSAGFPTMPFTFEFDGSFFHMEQLLHGRPGLRLGRQAATTSPSTAAC